MTKNNFICFLLVAIGMLSSCRFNSSYNNREVDYNAGKVIVDSFYNLVKNKNYSHSYQLMGKQLFEITDSAKINNLFVTCESKLGSIEEWEIGNWSSEAIVGTDSRTEYLYKVNVKRSKFTSNESVALLKENNEIKIIGYHVNSDGFLSQ